MSNYVTFTFFFKTEIPHETSVKTACVTACVRSMRHQITTQYSHRLGERAQLVRLSFVIFHTRCFLKNCADFVITFVYLVVITFIRLSSRKAFRAEMRFLKRNVFGDRDL